LQRPRFLSVLLTLGLLVGILSAAPAAHAQGNNPNTDKVQLFMPNDNVDKDQLSDKFDGVDDLAHLTAVAGPDVVDVIFLVCDTTTPTETYSQQDCFLAGDDDSGVQPQRPAGQEESSSRYDEETNDEKAFEAFFSTTDSGFDDTTADVWALGCTANESYPFSGGTAPSSCDNFDVVQDVYIDNTQGNGNEEVPTGEIVGICYETFEAFTNSDETYSDECNESSDFSPLIHGQVISGRGFTILFRTSEEVTDSSGVSSSAVDACLDEEADSNTEPSGCDEYAAEVSDTGEGGADYNEFVAKFQGEDVTRTGEADLAIFGETDDTAFQGECGSSFQTSFAAGCVFSEIYVQLAESTASNVGATFNDGNDRQPRPPFGKDSTSTRNQQRATGTACDDPQTTAQDTVGASEEVLGCLQDAFGRTAFADVTDTAITFESTGVGGFDASTCEGKTADTDSNGTADVCSEDVLDFWCDSSCDNVTQDGETDVTGVASVNVTSDEAGTQTITVCADSDADGSGGSGDSGQGCDPDEPTATLTKQWGGSSASRVDLVFEESQANGCAGADEFQEGQVGDTETLVVCTYDEFGNPTSTDALNADLEWDIDNPNAVAFTDQAGNPPGETGSDGTASATVRDQANGTARITVCLQTTGNADECDTVTKTVSGGGGGVGNPECSDDVDNDGDGGTDFDGPGAVDPDCTSTNDTSESASGQPRPLCSNNADDDGDGTIDNDGGPNGEPRDKGCSSNNDGSESPDPRTIRVASNITIRFDGDANPPAFKGSVGSSNRRCQRKRHVKLFRVRPGADARVGRDSSNFQGNWKIVKRFVKNGDYYVRVTKKRFTNRRGNLVICGRDKSPAIHHEN